MTANVIASSVLRSSHSSVHPSVNCRIGDEPMKVQHSIGSPVRCTISAMGLMSCTWVRAAQFARTRQARRGDLPGQALHVPRDVRTGPGQPDVGGVDAERVDEVQDVNLLVDASASAPTATATRRAGSRRRASPAAGGPGRRCGSSRRSANRSSRFQTTTDAPGAQPAAGPGQPQQQHDGGGGRCAERRPRARRRERIANELWRRLPRASGRSGRW